MTSQTALDHSRLNGIVGIIKKKLCDPSIRSLNNRGVQAVIFQIPEVSSYMTDLRKQEEAVRHKILSKVSVLVHKFQEHSLNATLARAGITVDKRVHAGSSLDSEEEFDLLCLDAKERLYMILQDYDWLKEFFLFYPLHFYENSFQFVSRIPKKKLPVKVKVVGLGIGGSLAVSGLRKNGIEAVIGYEKRARRGPRSVTSRYQNASWRAYDIAEKLLDEEAFQHMEKYQQQINVDFDDGTSKVMTSDRVQIILGDAIDRSLESAERYGAELHFDCDSKQFCKTDLTSDEDIEDVDIIALFAGARTDAIVPGLEEEMDMHAWPDLSSDCRLWLEIKMSEKKSTYTARNVEVGAEKWHFSIESSRDTKDDIVRIRDNLITQNMWSLKKLEGASEEEKGLQEEKFKLQRTKIEELLGGVEEKKDGEEKRFDYIFSNAPENDHNLAKLDAAKKGGNLVIEGGYRVDVKIASNSVIDSSSTESAKLLLDKFNTKVIAFGGDGCVNPNPMAAYGATLACEFAAMLVHLCVGHGHINAIINGMKKAELADPAWTVMLEEVQGLLTQYYDAHGRSENYFQWMQTLLCNLYSLPPQEA